MPVPYILLEHYGTDQISNRIVLPLNSLLDSSESSAAYPTKPANCRGSYTTASKEIVDIEIALCRNARIVTTGFITIGLGTIVTTTMEPLLKQMIPEEEGGLKN